MSETFYPSHTPEEIKKYCEWHKAAYGWNPFGGVKCLECGKPIHLIEVYRCYHCHAPFHLDCIKRHCKGGEEERLRAFLGRIMVLGLLREHPRLRDEALKILDGEKGGEG
jgi:hypothetical protein